MTFHPFLLCAGLQLAVCAAPAAARNTPLTDLDLSGIRQGWASPAIDGSVGGLPLSVGGTRYQRGLGTHAASLWDLPLAGKGVRLTGLVGVQDSPANEEGSCEFIVRGDNRELFRSGVIREGDAAKPLDINLAGINILTLEVTTGGDNNFSDHANWLDTVIEHNDAPLPIVAVATLPLPAAITIREATIDAAGHGLVPDTGKDATALLAALLDHAREHPGTTVRLAAGRYDFHQRNAHRRRHVQSNTTVVNPRRSAVLLEKHRATTIEGGGATLVLHGELTGITLDGCHDVTIRGLRVTLSRLLTTQAKVVELGAGFQVLEIDPQRFPFRIDNGRFLADAPSGAAPVSSSMEVDPATGRNLDGDGRRFERAELLAPNRLKVFGGKRVRNPGHLLILRHHIRGHAGIFVHGCRTVALDDVELWATAGLGILSQQSAGLSYRNTHIRPEPGSGLFCGPKDDGFHFSGCSGEILVENCHVSGTADDPINIHGTCLPVVEAKDPRTLVARFGHGMSIGQPLWARPGNRIALNERETLLTAATSTVKSFRLLDDTRAEIVLAEPFDVAPTTAHVLENLADTPSATIRGCTFENNRARGILCSTPGKVLIEDNIFRIAGAAILIPGDANGWFESGAVNEVTIRNNRFENCLICPTQFSDAVIAVWPEIHRDVPGRFFHRNIRIENNTILTFGGPLLYAHNAENLVFSNNTITPTEAFPAWHRIKSAIWLKHTRKVTIEGNRATGPLPATAIEVLGEGGESLQVGPDQPFTR